MKRLFSLLLLALPLGAQTVITGHVNVTGNVTFGISTSTAVTADYYISPATGTPTSPCSNGSDANDGTAASTGSGHGPWATWAHAVSAMTTAGVFGTKPLTIVFCQSTVADYGETVTLNATSSGTLASPVTWKAYPGHSPTISGGTKVTGLTLSTTGTCTGISNCYQVTLPGGTPYFERLWYNGQIRFRPRLGATAGTLQGAYGHSLSQVSGTGSGCSNSNVCGMVYCSTVSSTCPSGPDTSGGISNWSSCASNPCEVIAFAKWTASVLIIQSINTSTHTIIMTCGSSCASNGGFGGVFQPGFRYIIDNVKEKLANPGQWYYDKTTRQLTYIANVGETPGTDLVEIGNKTQLITGTGVNYTTISGLTLEHDNYVLPSIGFASAQEDPNLTNALITCSGCSHVTIQSNILRYTTADAVRFTGASANNTVQGNQIYDIGGYGVRIGTSPSTTSCSGSCDNSNTPASNTITANWIRYVSRFFPSADGVNSGLANATSVTSNEILYAYDKGIEICQPNCSKNSADARNLTLSGNDIRHIGQGVMTDISAIYAATSTSSSSSPGNVMSGNRGADVNGSFLQGDPNDIGAHAFYLDGQTGNWQITNNLGYRVGSNLVHMNEGPNVASQPNIIQNNILVDYANYTLSGSATGGFVGIQSPTTSVASFTFQSNICYEHNAAHTLVNQGHGPPSSSSTAQQDFVSNLYFNAGGGTEVFNVNGVGTSVSFANWKGSYGEDTAGTITTDPGFAHPSACSAPYDPIPGTCDDFSLPGGSPGFGFSTFPMTFGPGSSPSPAIPSVLATFPEAVCQTTGGCSF